MIRGATNGGATQEKMAANLNLRAGQYAKSPQNLKRRARSKRLTLEENHPCTTSDDTTTLDSRTPLVVLIMSRKSLRDSRSWKSRNLDEHRLLKQAHTRRFCEVNVVVKSARFTALSCFRIKAMVTGGDLGEPRGESRAEKRGRLNGAV